MGDDGKNLSGLLGTVELLDLVDKIRLVENLDERELTNPEGSGFDLRVGEIYRLKHGDHAHIGLKERHTPEIELVAKIGENKSFTIKPGEYYLFKTMEKLNLPDDMRVLIESRTTLFRSGVLFGHGPVHPGYSGELTSGLYNAGPCNFEIDLGARYLHISFIRTGNNVSSYRGQWQGGRVSTDGKKETQV